jgi:hypothetical protein
MYEVSVYSTGDEAGLSPAQRTRCARHTTFACDREHPLRGELERYVQEVFNAKHGARVKSFMPTLLALQGRGGQVCGVTGYRFATDEALFLERYLDVPIEEAIRAATNANVSRTDIVEVGNLASLRCKAAVHLVALLPRLLVDKGRSWVVFTATEGVRTILERFGAPVYELAPARAERVAGLGDEWGEYYRSDPRIMAGYLPSGFRLPGFERPVAR